jgi:histidinol-phosphatase (PHP family)
MPRAPLPPDDHVHSEWSWDAPAGSMERACARAVALGLRSIAFTEHVDVTRWVTPLPEREALRARGFTVDHDGRFVPPPLDVEGYLASVQRCRERFPDLTILAGVELGEPHLFADEARVLLAAGTFDRILGSLHTVSIDGHPWLIDHLMGPHAPADVAHGDAVGSYLADLVTMIRGWPDEVQVLAHIDYPVRGWVGRFAAARFEDGFRAVLAELASTGRALEVNTRVPLASEVVAWWRDVGGDAVSFGSDAHEPLAVADGFAEAVAMVEAHGFRPDRHPNGFWHR